MKYGCMQPNGSWLNNVAWPGQLAAVAANLACGVSWLQLSLCMWNIK